MQPEKPIDHDQPVAYDREGRPLYAHPSSDGAASQQISAAPSPGQPVYMTRPTEPADPVISEDIAKRHQESVSKYPSLNLSASEYVIMEVDKHWIGVIGPMLIGGFLALIVLACLALYPSLVPSGNPSFVSLIVPALLLIVLIALATYIVVWVYRNNRFFLTNECAIQNIQTSFFSHEEQTVSLGSIEDVSFHQSGILQLLLGYGTIRLSTIGDEDTYTFTFVANPRQKITTLNNAVESFKNGRPIKS